jgi:hypothetical protein
MNTYLTRHVTFEPLEKILRRFSTVSHEVGRYVSGSAVLLVQHSTYMYECV